MEITLGGNRLGSGSKQKVELHNYQMSSFNLEQDFKSTMAPGILYPFLKMIGTNHGTFDIDLDQFIRTIPTNGPLFGSFKFQADIFCVPIRLYQGILHNNPIKIGTNMDKVYLPKIELRTRDGRKAPRVKDSNIYNYQIADNALLKYLGLSGIGTAYEGQGGRPDNIEISRKFNAIPVLAYYDIFKNYYANKQEENAYVITPGNIKQKQNAIADMYVKKSYSSVINDENWQNVEGNHVNIEIDVPGFYYMQFTWEDLNMPLSQIYINFLGNTSETSEGTVTKTIDDLITESVVTIYEQGKNYIILSMSQQQKVNFRENSFNPNDNLIKVESIQVDPNENPTTTADIALTEFKLANIDTMRQRLLSNNFLGQEFLINKEDYVVEDQLEPYTTLVKQTTDGITYNAFAMNGLVVKTYQSDLYNNWLNAETINEITKRTTMDTSNGFTMDQLNFMEKSYEVLTRIATTDGSYEDWQEAVYGEGAIRKAETPMYMGGMSAEVMFEEVIATTDSTAGDEYQALGTLGGKGTAVNAKGGRNIHIKCEEPCYIIGIASLTPRIAYCQGNDWDLTELNSLDDLHKPGFDGIGFQDLMIEQMAWWNTQLIQQVTGFIENKHSAGKQTAWINYQTAVDKIYGDFCDINKSGYMVLNRNYERLENFEEIGYTVQDITTYIDPAKYNYAFSYKNLDAQNFWVQIHSKVIARRKMAAQQIPNL